MDNSNNSSSSNTISGTSPLNPTPQFGIPSQPLSGLDASSPPTPPSAQQNPTSAWTPPVSPSINTTNPSSAPQTFNPPSQSPQLVDRLNPTPASSADLSPLPTDNSSAWSNLSSTPSTPTTALASNGTPIPPSSPLDNPWEASVQPPAIDGLQQSPSQPTWIPSSPTSDISSPTQTVPVTPALESTPPPSGAGPNLISAVLSNGVSGQPEPIPAQSEQAPTDLSHLIDNNSQAESYKTKTDTTPDPSATPETLVLPPQAAGPVTEVSTIPTENHKGIPKWLIGVGAGLLIIVIGTSAFFILGIGQQQTTTSLPAEITKTTIKSPPPIPTPVPQANAPAATGSANFGQLQGGGAAASPQATSAADLLKQRQQGR